MPFYGGLSPFPKRFGGGGYGTAQTNRLSVVLQSLNSQMGTAYDTTQPSPVYARNMQLARALCAVWSGNQRLANQFDPVRMTDFLPRWEVILNLYPLSTDTLAIRRARVSAALARVLAIPTYSYVFNLITTLFGSNATLVQIISSNSSSADVWVPVSWPASAFWQQDPSGQIDWYSSVMFLAFQVSQPLNAGLAGGAVDDSTFYNTVNSIFPVLDAVLPAWMTFQWFRRDISSRVGFYLDEGKNLDNEGL